MKKILFSLLLLAGFAAANTCTQVWFNAQPHFLSTPQNTPYLDSVYSAYLNRFSDSTDIREERYVKLSYSNGYLEKIINGYVGDIENILTEVDHIHVSKDESILSKEGLEGLISDSTVGDTTFWVRKHYVNGKLDQAMFYKETEFFSSCMDSTFDYYYEYFSRNDSLIYIHIDNYSSEANRKTEYVYIIEDPADDLKCYEYSNDSLEHVMVYNKNEKGFSVKVFENDIVVQELFFVDPSSISAIRKQHPAAKVSPKARYFDLLGRYKYTR
jgi:hypothetical protein